MKLSPYLSASLLGGLLAFNLVACDKHDDGTDHHAADEAHEHGADTHDHHDAAPAHKDHEGEGEHEDDHGHQHADEAESHAHDHHTPTTPEFEHKDYGSTAKAWDTLTASVNAAETAVGENKFDAIHAIYPDMAASAHYLLDNSKLDDEAKQVRLKAALAQLTKAIEAFHEYTHSGDDYATEANRELKKIKGALKQIEVYQFSG